MPGSRERPTHRGTAAHGSDYNLEPVINDISRFTKPLNNRFRLTFTAVPMLKSAARVPSRALSSALGSIGTNNFDEHAFRAACGDEWCARAWFSKARPTE